MEYITIDKLSLDALPLQLHSSFVRAIVSQRLHYLEQLPPAQAVADQFNISLSYVKKAYQFLQRDGMVTATKGRGTFVSYRPRYIVPLPDVLNFTSYLEPLSAIDTRIVLIDTIKDHPVIYATLGLSEGEPVFVVKRLVFHEKRPFAFQHIFLPRRFHPNFRKNYPSYKTVYDYVANGGENIIHEVLTQGSAIRTDDKVSALLDLPLGAPLHGLHSDIVNIQHQKIAVVLTYLSGEHVTLEVNV